MSRHYLEEWGPSDNRRLTCACGNEWPCPDADWTQQDARAACVEVPVRRNSLVIADEDGRIDVSEDAHRFADQCAALIRKKLPGAQRRFFLMPYRRPFGHEFLGFDWQDETGARLGFTINYGDTAYLPDPVWPHMNCITVLDATDALHLCRLIAERVNGNSIGGA